MNLNEMLATLADGEILDRFPEVYPRHFDRPSYAAALAELRGTVPEPPEKPWYLTVSEDRDLSGRDVVSVSGRLPDDPEYYAMEFSPWPEWLSLPVDPAAVERFGALDVMVHVLWEITFCGYSDAEVSGERDELRRRYDECENHPEDLIPLETVMADARAILGDGGKEGQDHE